MLRTPCSSPSPPAESMDCNKRPGFYYDDLVKNCIKCSSVCGQHPKECALSCERELGKGHQTHPLRPRGLQFEGCHFTRAGEKQPGHLFPIFSILQWLFPVVCWCFTGRAAPSARAELAAVDPTWLSCPQPSGRGNTRGQVDPEDLQVLHWG